MESDDDAALLAADALTGAAAKLIGPDASVAADALDIEALQREDELIRAQTQRALAERAAARAETAELLQQPADEGLEAWRAERERWLAEQLAAAGLDGGGGAPSAADADAAADDDVFLTAGGAGDDAASAEQAALVEALGAAASRASPHKHERDALLADLDQKLADRQKMIELLLGGSGSGAAADGGGGAADGGRDGSGLAATMPPLRPPSASERPPRPPAAAAAAAAAPAANGRPQSLYEAARLPPERAWRPSSGAPAAPARLPVSHSLHGDPPRQPPPSSPHNLALAPSFAPSSRRPGSGAATRPARAASAAAGARGLVAAAGGLPRLAGTSSSRELGVCGSCGLLSQLSESRLGGDKLVADLKATRRVRPSSGPTRGRR